MREHWKEIAGTAAGLALLAFVLATADLGKVVEGFRHFQPALLPILFGLIAGREAVRVVEWRMLLRQAEVRPGWRYAILALLSGDAAQLVPGGIYLSNVVLKRAKGANTARSLAATLATQLLEAFVCLAALTAIGVSGWPWLRPAAATVLGGFLGFLFLVTRPGVQRWLEQDAGGHTLLARLRDGLKQFLQTLAGLGNAWLITRAILLAAAHLAFTVAALYVISRGIGIDAAWTEITAIYAFVLTLINLNPLPTDLGVSEGGGVSIFTASGVDSAQGLTAMLLIRFAIIGGTALLLGLAMAAFPAQVKDIAEGDGAPSPDRAA